MDLVEKCTTVYTAQTKHYFHSRMLICKFAIENGVVPLNPFNLWGYFLYELVERDLVRRANNNIVRITDEIWVFGPIADGVLFEIEYAMQMGKPIKYFSIGSSIDKIHAINVTEVEFEEDVLENRDENEIRNKLIQYNNSFSNHKYIGGTHRI